MTGRRALTLCLLLLGGLLGVTEGLARSIGENGGIRLLLHVDEGAAIAPGARLTEDPCLSLPPVGAAEEFVVDYDGEADTVMVWVYLYHPRQMEVRGLGFGIDFEGVKVVTSGTCAPRIWQEEEKMGKWAQRGSEIAFAWDLEGYPTGQLAAVGWFVLERLDRDGFFRLFEGRSKMTGMVGDTNIPPKGNRFWGYGKVGFGSTPGELPIATEEETPRAWGAVQLGLQ
jgi:hypothetical protein